MKSRILLKSLQFLNLFAKVVLSNVQVAAIKAREIGNQTNKSRRMELGVGVIRRHPKIRSYLLIPPWLVLKMCTELS